MCIGDKVVVVYYKSYQWVCCQPLGCADFNTTNICRHKKVRRVSPGDPSVKIFGGKGKDLIRAGRKALKWIKKKQDQFYCEDSEHEIE